MKGRKQGAGRKVDEGREGGVDSGQAPVSACPTPRCFWCVPHEGKGRAAAERGCHTAWRCGHTPATPQHTPQQPPAGGSHNNIGLPPSAHTHLHRASCRRQYHRIRPVWQLPCRYASAAAAAAAPGEAAPHRDWTASCLHRLIRAAPDQPRLRPPVPRPPNFSCPAHMHVPPASPGQPPPSTQHLSRRRTCQPRAAFHPVLSTPRLLPRAFHPPLGLV